MSQQFHYSVFDLRIEMMICNFYSVLFLHLILMFLCYFASSNKLKFLLATENDIIRCSEDEYVVIRNWTKFESSNISCPNQNKLFESSPPPMFSYIGINWICVEAKKKIVLTFYTRIRYLKENKMQTFPNDTLKQMSFTVNIGNQSYAYEAKMMPDNNSVALINNFELAWSHNNTFVLYITFTNQPTICRVKLNLSVMVNITHCTNIRGSYSVLCYNYPRATSLIQQNVDWTLLDALWRGATYTSSNWINLYGGYHVDLRLLNTTDISVS